MVAHKSNATQGRPKSKRPTALATTGNSKPRQRKSRDGTVKSVDGGESTDQNVIHGCKTCKASRLKCDESKPSCERCALRKKKCGGYEKGYRWLSYETDDFLATAGGYTKGKSESPDLHERLTLVEQRNQTEINMRAFTCTGALPLVP